MLFEKKRYGLYVGAIVLAFLLMLWFGIGF